MSNSPNELQLIELWPTLFLSQGLPGHEPHTERLCTLAGERPDEGVFGIDDPSVHWLKAHVAHGVNAYLRECGAGDAGQWGARGWFEILDVGEYRGLHNRPHADLCGMYVLRGIEGYDAARRRDDLRPGALSFFDPRSAMNMNAINGDPYQRYQHTLQPVPGLLVIWPASVSYFVHPNLGREPVVRVAFDVLLPEESASPPGTRS